MRRTITRSIIIGICVAFAIAMGFAFFLRSKQPQYKGEKTLAGLEADAEVLFDKWAIPHIAAKNEKDAYFALGYLHAQDRLFQMEFMRRLGRGELAEILGPAVLKYDTIFRTLGVRETAKQLAERSRSSRAYPSMLAYLAGINSFIETGPKPIEFDLLRIKARPFEPADSFAIAGYMAFSFMQAMKSDPVVSYIEEYLPAKFKKEIFPFPMFEYAKWDHEDRRLFESLNASLQDLLKEPFTVFEGSNAWVVSGERTRSGMPILANDPHIGFASPAVWYEAAMDYPGFKLYGHYLAGVPTALLGHGEKHGWGVTMLQNKDTEFYKERRNPENPKQVWYRDRWEDLKIRTERIKVKGEDDVVLEVESTRHGPIINGIVEGYKNSSDPIALTWGFINPENEIFEGFYELARATTYADASVAVSRIQSPGINVVYANTSGDIAWWTVGRFGIRPEHVRGRTLLDGASGLDEVDTFFSFPSHPMLLNPPEGFLVTANQDPFRDHPYKLEGYYNPDFRYDAIHARLAAKSSSWTVDDMKGLQTETQNDVYKRMSAPLLDVLAKQNTQDPVEHEAVEVLKQWDFKHGIESAGATIFQEFLGHLIGSLFHERLTDVYFDLFKKSNLIHEALLRILENPQSPWWEKDGLAMQETLLLQTWQKSVESLRQRHGDKPRYWNWGRVHTVAHKHVLGQSPLLAWVFNIGPMSAPGSTEVINNFNFVMSPGLHEVHSGPSARRIIDFKNPGESWGVLPTGQSGYFANSHYKDQAPLYHQGEYRLQVLDRSALKESKRLVLLAPKKASP